jgi:peptide/nickel transport system permease protein
MSTRSTAGSTVDTTDARQRLESGRLFLPSNRRERLRRAFRQFFRNKWLNVLAVAIIFGFLFTSIFGNVLAPYPPNEPSIFDQLQGPSRSHILGTDDLGRDILSRVMSGARISLGVAAIVLSLAVSLGCLIGGISGFAGGIYDDVLMRVTDLFLAFPFLVLAIAISASLGPSLRNTVIALSVVYWPWYARLVRGQVLLVKNREYVEAARSVGASSRRILLRHVFPNALSPVIVQLTLDVGFAILATSSLSFIGLGAQPPTPEWGSMINSARSHFQDAWWFITFPGMALAITVLGFNLLGDGLRDFLDPRTRGL